MNNLAPRKLDSLTNWFLDDPWINDIFDLAITPSKYLHPLLKPITVNTFRTSLQENESSYILTADLPGVEEKDIKITYEDDALSINVERQKEASSDENSNYLWKEVEYSNMSRSFRIPDIDEKNVQAKLAKGVLSVTLNKTKPNAERRQIPIIQE